MRPGATGYSPLRMWTSVPQMVVIVTRTMASVGPQEGIARSCSVITPGRSKTAARMVPDPLRAAAGWEEGAAVMADLAWSLVFDPDATARPDATHRHFLPANRRGTTEPGR